MSAISNITSALSSLRCHLYRFVCTAAVVMTALLTCGCEKNDAQVPTYVVALEATFPPYEFYRGNEIVGIDVDILNEIGRRKGVKFKLEDMAFDSIITAVQTGKVDLVVSGLTVTEDRKRMVDFTRPYSGARQVIIVPKGAPEYKPEDLRKIRVGVQHGSSGDAYVTENIGEPERFTEAPKAVWDGYFFSEEPDGYFKGAHMDFNIIVPFSEKAEEGAWKKSKLEKVKEYILRQLED